MRDRSKCTGFVSVDTDSEHHQVADYHAAMSFLRRVGFRFTGEARITDQFGKVTIFVKKDGKLEKIPYHA